jgi:flagellar FliL protein
MADEKDIAEGQPAGGRKKLIIIVVAVVLLLAAAAAAAVLLLDSEKDQAAAGESAAQAAVVEEQGDPIYQALAPAFVVNLPPGGSAKMLQIAIEVMTRNPTVIDTLSANDPMIRHHLLNLLEGQQADELLTVEGKESLQTAIHELLAQKLAELNEPGEIKGVFFTQFVMQ